mgnify:CR=1 FL=1
MISSLIGRAATVGAVAAIALAGFGAARLDKSIDLNVDGQLTSMHVFGSTVGDALAKSGVTVGEHDLVSPAADQAIEDGSQVVVRYGRKVTVTVDGATTDYWTTATTVDQAMNELGIRALSGATLSVSRSAGLGREGEAVAAAGRVVAAFDPVRLWAHPPAFNAILVRELLRLDAARPDAGLRAWCTEYLSRVWSEARDPATGLFTGGGIGHYDAGVVLDHAALTGAMAALASAGAPDPGHAPP